MAIHDWDPGSGSTARPMAGDNGQASSRSNMISCRTNFCLTCAFHVLHPHSAIFRHAHMSHDRHAMSHLPSRERDANHIMVSPYSNFKTARADTESFEVKTT
jgi:hypothetical protein